MPLVLKSVVGNYTCVAPFLVVGTGRQGIVTPPRGNNMTSDKKSGLAEQKGFSYFRFIGRLLTSHPLVCNRREYFLFQIISLAILVVVVLIFGLAYSSMESTPLYIGIGITTIGALIVYGILSLIATAGRLHDVGRSAVSLFWLLVPTIGGFVILVMVFWPSDASIAEGENNPYKVKLPSQMGLEDRVKGLVDEGRVGFLDEPVRLASTDYDDIADEVSRIAQLLDDEITDTESSITPRALKAINALLYQYAARLLSDEIDLKFDSDKCTEEHGKMVKAFSRKLSLREEAINAGLSEATALELRHDLLITLDYRYSINLYVRQVEYVICREYD